MNTYKTFSSRTSPQIVQRHFDIKHDGKSYRAHGVKGGNGEWVLEVYLQGWETLGNAWKQDKGWVIYTAQASYWGRTLTEVIVATFPKEA